MNKTTAEGNWNVVKGRLKKAYADLTDDDLKYTEGQKDELIGHIQKKVGRSRDEIAKYFDDNDAPLAR